MPPAAHSPTLRHRYPTRAPSKLQPTSTLTSATTTTLFSTTPSSPPTTVHPLPTPSDPLPPPSPPPPPYPTQRIHPSQIFPSVPFHRKAQPSILSAEAPPTNFRGLYNLAGITLITLTARLVIENLSRYGVRWQMTVLRAVVADPNWGCLVIAALVCGGSPVVAWGVEELAASRRLSSVHAAWLHAVHIALVLVVPCVIITVTEAGYLSGMVLVIVEMLVVMKLISYAHVCYDIRSRMLDPPTPSSSEAEEQQAASSVFPLPPHLDVSALHPQLPAVYAPSLRHMFYFIAAPTLIYQLSYPRSASIRLPFLLRRVAELCFCLALQLLLVEQYLAPAVRNAMQPIASLHYLSILERILKIALPNGCVWLLMFYAGTRHSPPPRPDRARRADPDRHAHLLLTSLAVFHSWLNIVGELLRFSDRLFYRDWWNCQDLAVYWANWNLPVHNFIMRHVYAPALRSGLSPWSAQLVSFLVSAVMHELLVAVPLHTLRMYAFSGMLLQVPLIWFTKVREPRPHHTPHCMDATCMASCSLQLLCSVSSSACVRVSVCVQVDGAAPQAASVEQLRLLADLPRLRTAHAHPPLRARRPQQAAAHGRTAHRHHHTTAPYMTSSYAYTVRLGARSSPVSL